jgi:hypothetical protein
MGWTTWDSNQGGGKRFVPSPYLFTPALGPIHPPLQWVTVVFPRGKTSWIDALTTHPNLVLKLRIRRAMPLLSLWASSGATFTFTFTLMQGVSGEMCSLLYIIFIYQHTK